MDVGKASRTWEVKRMRGGEGFGNDGMKREVKEFKQECFRLRVRVKSKSV